METRQVLTCIRRLGHVVPSGSWPLYRITAVMLLCGSIAQLSFGPPPSVAATTPPWFDPIFLTMMLVASTLICVAIMVMGEDNMSSGYVEQAGVSLMFGAIGISMVSYFINTGIPRTYQSWVPIGIAIYCLFRYVEIQKLRAATFAEKVRRVRARSAGDDSGAS